MTSAQTRRHPGARPCPKIATHHKPVAAHDARKAIQPPTAPATGRIDPPRIASQAKNRRDLQKRWFEA
ncbi:MAG: hypothetical protein LC790_07060, partial [Actinobacteria bacterium]|nr:hypothetical protein [Actinomycetota bacterium]